MNQSRGLGGTVYEGLPLVDAVPTGLPTPTGVIAALVLVVKPGVDQTALPSRSYGEVTSSSL
ncbi:hypothetical protein EES45_36170 [Streptomyces sp. ADI97-07]|uniref:hypothetical protein n=1 Tax=Streptomyces sp. ADI97-07 TaxID=1522762 RepID=UPI000F554DB6|nr:hypothetical protein [Streptomyces sp. ADI97-07]RPK70077.1 hypothetical protein EES45_36170 [Streptomyces sp. ADI97-07]